MRDVRGRAATVPIDMGNSGKENILLVERTGLNKSALVVDSKDEIAPLPIGKRDQA